MRTLQAADSMVWFDSSCKFPFIKGEMQVLPCTVIHPLFSRWDLGMYACIAVKLSCCPVASRFVYSALFIIDCGCIIWHSNTNYSSALSPYHFHYRTHACTSDLCFQLFYCRLAAFVVLCIVLCNRVWWYLPILCHQPYSSVSLFPFFILHHIYYWRLYYFNILVG